MASDNKHIYTNRGVSYKVIGDNELDTERLIRDFLYCESIKDYTTIKNRVINGLEWGWLIKVTS